MLVIQSPRYGPLRGHVLIIWLEPRHVDCFLPSDEPLTILTDVDSDECSRMLMEDLPSSETTCACSKD